VYVLVSGPEEGGELCEEAAGAALLEEAEQPRGRGVHGVPAGDAAEPVGELHHGGAYRGPPVPGGGGRVPRLLCQVEESPLLRGNLGERKGKCTRKKINGALFYNIRCYARSVLHVQCLRYYCFVFVPFLRFLAALGIRDILVRIRDLQDTN
jgi:hypothetical protein